MGSSPRRLGPPNKPMVPTAPASPAANSSHPMRRHIGQPLDSLESGGRRPASEHESGRGHRGKQRRTTDIGLRSTSDGRRAANDVTTCGAATAAVSTSSERPASGTATVAMSSALSVSNKPMVPTAHTWLAGNAMDPLRRHMGQPLDSQKSGERRPASEQNSGRVQRTTGCGQRTTSVVLRAVNSGQ